MTGFVIASLILIFLTGCAVFCVADIFARCEEAQHELLLDELWDCDECDDDELVWAA